MAYEDIIKILLAAGSLAFGAFLTALRGKIISTNEKNKIHYFFYIFSVLVIISSLLSIKFYWQKLIEPSWFGIIVIFASIISSTLLIWFTKKHLVGVHDYAIADLNPIVNNFTENADKECIMLFGGDLNFFGGTPDDMNRNSQYTILRGANFRNIQILCEEPNSNQSKIRYGKIIIDLPMVELKFYEPKAADLKIRGRMKKFNGITKLLFYIRVQSGIYRALQTDTSNYNGALYENIWHLVWSLARTPKEIELEEYKKLFRN